MARFACVHRGRNTLTVIGESRNITDAMRLCEIHAERGLKWNLGGEDHRIYSDSGEDRTNYHIQDRKYKYDPLFGYNCDWMN